MSDQCTPSPWRVERQNPSPTTGEWMIAVAKPGYLAEVRDCGSGNVAANARLIAAAPDLLDALKEARATLATALKSTAPDWFVTEEDVKEHLSIKKMDNAIAKATGSTP